MGNIWIIGHTGSGKSTYARRLSEKLNLPVLEAGKFARELCERDTDAITITEKANQKLQENHRHFSQLIKNELNSLYFDKFSVIIVGARNPVDFSDSFNPKADYIVFLEGTLPLSEFEAYGINAIKSIVRFFYFNLLMEYEQFRTLTADKESENWYDAAHFERKLIRARA